MSRTSIANETSKDNNENGISDANPSKTLGAESGPDEPQKGKVPTVPTAKSGTKQGVKEQAQSEGLVDFPPALPDRPHS